MHGAARTAVTGCRGLVEGLDPTIPMWLLYVNMWLPFACSPSHGGADRFTLPQPMPARQTPVRSGLTVGVVGKDKVPRVAQTIATFSSLRVELVGRLSRRQRCS